MLKKDFTRVDIVVKVQMTESVHAIERGVDHLAIFKAIGEEIGIDECRLQYGRIAEHRLAGFDFDEGDVFEVARIEHDVIQDQAIKPHVGETAINVDHVLDRLVELDVRIGDVHQSRRLPVVVLALQVFDVLGKPQ